MTWRMVVRIGLIGAIGWAVMQPTLAGCRAVAYEDLDDIDPADAARALCLWVNSPANPHGVLVDLGAAAEWGRGHGVPVLSDECYVEFTWEGPGRTILEHGLDGVVAVHSLSKRSNLAGLRVGFYGGDPDLVQYLSEVRKHVGMMVPGPAQAASFTPYGTARSPAGRSPIPRAGGCRGRRRRWRSRATPSKSGSAPRIRGRISCRKRDGWRSTANPRCRASAWTPASSKAPRCPCTTTRSWPS